MSENKFIKKLKGVATTGSVLELENQATPTSFANMPSGTSNPNTVYSDHRGNATAVLKGTQNWKLNGSALDLATQVNGDGTDYTGDIQCSGSGLWVNATYTFPSTGDLAHPVAAIFNAGTKWVLKLCGHGLLSHNKTIDFSLVVKLGTSNIMTKNFTISEQAFEFCQEFIIDYDESIQSLVKAQGGSTLTVQLLCGDASASATIYNGMTVLTCLQRGVDASTVSASFANVEEVMHDGLLPNDYFSNAAFIGQVNDGDKAYAVFQRGGDEMNLAGWDEPIPSQTGNASKYLTTDGSDMSWHQITASDVGALPDSTKYGASFVLSMNSSTFVITAQLKDQDGNNLGSAQTIDLPLESVVVNGSYDNATKSLILTLENGNTITIPVADLISGLQEELVSGTNIKTINGNSILGAGNLQVSGFLPYEAGWTTNSTTKAFCDNIAADGSAVVGNAYLGEVTINDMPAGIGNGEIKVYILDGTNASNKVIQLELTSGNVAPYKWIYTYWNGGSDVSGWVTWATSAQGALADTAVQPADLATYVTTNTTQTITGEKVFRGIMNYSAGMTYILAGADGTKLGYWSYDIDGQSNITLQTMTASTRNINFKTNNGGKVTYNGSEIAKVSAIPTAVSQLSNDSGFITNAVNDLQNYTLSSSLATVATSGDYDDLINKPTIPAAQVNSDWNANSGVAQILNKPTLGTMAAESASDYTPTASLAAVATSGQYSDLTGTPTIPTVNNPTITITQGGVTKGSFTLNQASGDTIALDAGGGGGLPDQTGHAGEFLTTDGTDASWSDAIGYHPDLFDVKWADHILNDVQWLRADTFSWQAGSVYQAAYQHLADDITGKTLQSETISGTTIQFYLADDGHKICPASEESNVAAIYTATGVAWYYILDTTNHRFKLPRTKRDFSGLVDSVGSGTQGSTKIIPDFTHAASISNGYVATTDGWVVAFGMNGSGDIFVNGATVAQGNWYSGKWSGNTNCQIMVKQGDVITWSYSGTTPTIYFAPNTTGTEIVSTQQYLYFYIGNFTQTALENTAGLNAELFNGKVDTGHQVIAFQAPTAQNNYTWCRLYADGWVEQGGALPVTVDSAITITIPVEMADINYTLQLTRTFAAQNTGSANNGGIATWNKTTTSFMCWGKYYDTVTDNWTVCGMAA